MFTQGRRHLGILRKAKPLPAVPGWSRWQRGRGISCSCLVLVQERGGGCAALKSYLRGSGFGRRDSVHGKRYTRTPRTCPLRAGRCRMMCPPSSHIPTPCCAAGARTVSYCDSLHSAKAVPSCTVLGCGAYIAADSRASSPDVNFGTLTPCCLACVLFTHWKLWIYCQRKQPQPGSQRYGLHAAFLPGKPCHIMTYLPPPFLRSQYIS